jgi:GNAT superfamily N-acetyltransferase
MMVHGVASRTSALKVRPFRNTDAPRLAEWIDQLAPADDVYTPSMLLHQRHMLPRRLQPLWLVALIEGEPIGLARDEPQIFGSRPGVRRTWVGVRPDVRRRGIGAELWQRIEAHARQVGALTLRSWSVPDVSDGERFLVTRGFTRVQRELQSWIDPTSLDAHELERLTANALQLNFEVKTIATLLPAMETQVRRMFLSADPDAHRQPPRARPVAPTTFRRVVLRNPLLDYDCSVVVLRAGEPVALSWLKGDRRVGKYAVEFTATAPEWRGRGLAKLAKLTALHRAAQAGVRWVGTGNDVDNVPMLAINRQLGHRSLPDLVIYERAIRKRRSAGP